MFANKSSGRGNDSTSPTNSSPTSVFSLPQALKSVSVTISEHSSAARPSSKMEHIKKHTLAGLTMKGKDKERNNDKEKEKEKEKHFRHASPSPARKPDKSINSLDMFTESPPNMLLKGPRESSGALFSAQLLLNVVDPEIVVESFEMKLNVVVTTKKPVVKDCFDCAAQKNELHKWTFLKEPKRLVAGEHKFPFSYLFPGHLPATTQGNIGILKYFLDAQATLKRAGSSSGDRKETTITMHREIPVLRAKQEAADRGHTRLFPPTNLAAYCTFPPVIFPIGDFSLHMRMNGCNEKDEKKGIVFRWRLRKLSWRLEEKEMMTSHACSKHAAKVGGDGKGVQYEDVRIIARGDTNEGWKTDMSDGTVEMELACRPFANPRPQCDVDSPSGLRVSHQLVVELVISEEWAKLKNLAESTPTGSARVLRMTFPIEVTERAGLGISWDEETPPVYQDVPASPPVYPQKDSGTRTSAPVEISRSGGEIMDYTGPPLGTPPSYEEELEGFRLGETRASMGSSSRPTSQDHDLPSPQAAARSPRALNAADFETE